MPRNRSEPRRRRLKITLRKVVIVAAVFIAIGVALPFGCVGNRAFNTEPADYLRIFETERGLPFAVGVVEFDDQGEPWNLQQLDALVERIRRYNAESEHGIVLYQFIHGWKSNASRDRKSGRRLAWFEEQVAAVARHSDRSARETGEPPRPVVGLFIGWRGRTYSLPGLIDVSFWNRRVAAHRVASMRLIEVLYRTALAAKEHPESKCALLGHSMGGLVLEKTLGAALVTEIMTVEHTGGSIPVNYELIVSANSSTEALYGKQLIDVLKRTTVELVLEDDDGARRPAAGPLMASITSSSDSVTRWMVPLAMTFNSLFVRYRDYPDPGAPSQRHLGLHTTGHVPHLFSHTLEMRDDELVLRELPERWNDTPFWVFQVPEGVSSDHRDISSPVWSRLMLKLLAANEVFDPTVDLRLADGP